LRKLRCSSLAPRGFDQLVFSRELYMNMNAMDTNTMIVIGIIVVLLVIGIALLARRSRSRHLADRFGPEYDRAVERTGSRGKAEADLAEREKRVRKLEIVPLSAAEAQRYRLDWQALQARFVDNPRTAVAEADLLVRDVMMRRGYPMTEFDSMADLISVDHPHVVEHYRAAHDIALRERQSQLSTEDLRQALVHYRALFGDLLETTAEPARRREERRAEEPRTGGLLRADRAMASDEAAARERERRKER
jgi:hypothetical protein